MRIVEDVVTWRRKEMSVFCSRIYSANFLPNTRPSAGSAYNDTALLSVLPGEAHCDRSGMAALRLS